MKIYTDKEHEYKYYASDKYIKNLKPIEINSIEEYLMTTLDILPLFGVNALVTNQYDELKSIPSVVADFGTSWYDEDHPYNIIDLPFLEGLNHSQIMLIVYRRFIFPGTIIKLLEEMTDVCSFHVSSFTPMNAPAHDKNGNEYDSLTVYDISFADGSTPLGIIHTICADMITNIEVYSFKDR